jgi:hypothetical protein
LLLSLLRGASCLGLECSCGCAGLLSGGALGVGVLPGLPSVLVLCCGLLCPPVLLPLCLGLTSCSFGFVLWVGHALWVGRPRLQVSSGACAFGPGPGPGPAPGLGPFVDRGGAGRGALGWSLGWVTSPLRWGLRGEGHPRAGVLCCVFLPGPAGCGCCACLPGFRVVVASWACWLVAGSASLQTQN